jgi:hypothetical protein
MSMSFAVVSNKSLESKYFKLLDYKNLETRQTGRELEAHLCKKADEIIEFIRSNPDFKPSKKQSTLAELGMYLAYTGLYLMNNNNGFINGDLSYKEIISSMKLDSGTDGREEIYRRYELAHKYFTLGEKLAPEDDRIQGWHLSSLFRFQKYKTGKVEEDIMDKIVAHVVSQPIFHLFNALTMNSDYSFGEKRERKLLEITEFLGSKDSPCAKLFFRTGEAKKCNTTNRTPFAFQGVTTYMGDTFLREAYKSADTDPERALIYAKKAQGQYVRVDWFIFKPKAKRWKMYEYLPQRKELAEQMVNGGHKDETFFGSRKFLDTYSCVSCHQNGTVKGALDIRL